MLTEEGMRDARLKVTRIDKFIEAAKQNRPNEARGIERELSWGNREFMIHGYTTGRYAHPYPGMHGNGGHITLRRDQAEHLAVELLKNLAPGGELPTDAAELLDFVSSVIRNGSAPA